MDNNNKKYNCNRFNIDPDGIEILDNNDEIDKNISKIE